MEIEKPIKRVDKQLININIMAKVSITNITVNVNNFQSAYNHFKLGPIPPNTNVDHAVASIEKALKTELSKNWPKANPSPSYAPDAAIMAPWKANVPGTAPKCVIDAITQNFDSWGLPVDKNAIQTMAKQITQEISNSAGLNGYFYGQSSLGASQTIYWGISYISVIVVDKPEEYGIIYGFSASLGLN